MDTQRTFLISNIANLPDEIAIPEIPANIQADLKKIVSFSDAMQDVEQLFQVFIFNLDQLHNFCTMYYSDKVIRNKDKNSASFIEINALFINVISSGKTLTDGIENFFKNEFDETRYKAFRTNYSSKKYDDIFSYRFLSFLRNFAQHGHLPVSINPQGQFCFDLSQIIKTEHFNLSSSIKKSMEDVFQEIIEHYKTDPYIAFTYTLDTYTLSVIELYYNFYQENESTVLSYHNERNKILAEHPELILHNDGIMDGMVVYDIEDTTLHTFPKDDNIWNMYVDFKGNAKKTLKLYKKAHMELG